MAIASIAAVRDGIKTNLATITGLRVRDTLPETIEPPMAVVWLQPPFTFDKAMQRGVDEGNFHVTVFVSRADERTAQDKLDGYMNGTGATSVKTAIETDKTLGGSVGDSRVTQIVDFGPVAYAGTEYLAVEFNVYVVG